MSLHLKLIRLAIRRSKQADAVLSFAAGKIRRDVTSESLQNAFSQKFRSATPATVRDFKIQVSDTSLGLRYFVDATVGIPALPAQMVGAERRMEKFVLDIIHIWAKGLPGETSIKLRKSWPLITFQITGKI